MSGIQEHAERASPPDEWLALSEAERAAVLRRAGDLDLNETEAAQWVEVQECTEQPLEPDEICCEPAPAPTFHEVLQSAELLEPDERIRLTSRLLLSLPIKDRAALITLGLESLEHSANDAVRRATPKLMELLASGWRNLFDPANTSQLYSAPRRFDLATIFVVTAAYSLLFGGLTSLDAGPLPKVVLGSVVSIVAVCQALFFGISNPRGVSVVAGAAAYTLFSLILYLNEPRTFDSFFFFAPRRSFIFAVFINGLVGGAVLGYVSGVLVGGVFLVADILRRRFGRELKHETEEDRGSVSGQKPI